MCIRKEGGGFRIPEMCYQRRLYRRFRIPQTRVSESQLFGMETGWEDNQFEVYCSEIEIVQGMHQILGDKEMIVGEADSDKRQFSFFD